MKETIVRGLVQFFFVSRYWALLILLGLLGWLTRHVYYMPGTTIRDAVAVFAGGAVVITIFYAFVNYEYTQRKFKHDIKLSKELLSFNIAMEWQKEYMTKNTNVLRAFYLRYKFLLEDGKPRKFQKQLDKPEHDDQYTALMVVVNFLESVALGVKQGIMDEEFIKGFFSGVFKLQYNRYLPYIEYRRIAQQNPKIWENFTYLSKKWITC